MAKPKIYDIRPKKVIEKEKLYFSKKRKISYQPFLKICSGILIFLILLWYFLPAQSATIKLYPSTKTFSSEITVNLDSSSEASINYESYILPVTPLETEKTITKEFQASLVDVSTKARGIVRIFNKYKRNITLVKNTRLVSATEPARLFYLTKRITIPANGHIDVEVVASEAGEEYNIEPTTFSIPGLRNFSPPELYYDVFGKSFEKMKGGRKQTIRQITQEDVQNAVKEIKQLIEKNLSSFLEEKYGSEYFILKKLIEYEILEEGLKNAKVGEEKDKFSYEIQIKVSGWGIKLEDLFKFAKQYLKSQIPPGFEIADDNINIESNLENKDLNQNISVNFVFAAKVYEKIDETFFKEISKGQTRSIIVRNIYQVYSAFKKKPQIKLVPFFARRAPNREDKINIQIILD